MAEDRLYVALNHVDLLKAIDSVTGLVGILVLDEDREAAPVEETGHGQVIPQLLHTVIGPRPSVTPPSGPEIPTASIEHVYTYTRTAYSTYSLHIYICTYGPASVVPPIRSWYIVQ